MYFFLVVEDFLVVLVELVVEFAETCGVDTLLLGLELGTFDVVPANDEVGSFVEVVLELSLDTVFVDLEYLEVVEGKLVDAVVSCLGA